MHKNSRAKVEFLKIQRQKWNLVKYKGKSGIYQNLMTSVECTMIQGCVQYSSKFKAQSEVSQMSRTKLKFLKIPK